MKHHVRLLRSLTMLYGQNKVIYLQMTKSALSNADGPISTSVECFEASL